MPLKDKLKRALTALNGDDDLPSSNPRHSLFGSSINSYGNLSESGDNELSPNRLRPSVRSFSMPSNPPSMHSSQSISSINTSPLLPTLNQSVSPFKTQPMPRQYQSMLPPASSASTSSSRRALPPLSHEDITKYSMFFDKLDSQGGRLSKDQAWKIFENSGLKDDVLMQTWNLVDRNRCGEIGRSEFAIALYLLNLMKTKKVAQLPDRLKKGFYEEVSEISTRQQANPQKLPRSTTMRDVFEEPADSRSRPNLPMGGISDYAVYDVVNMAPSRRLTPPPTIEPSARQITIYVKEKDQGSPQSFLIHENFLVYHSPVLKSIIEGGKITIKILCDPAIFSLLATWLYDEKLRDKHQSEPQSHSLVYLYVLAYQLQIPDLCNQVVSLYMRVVCKPDRVEGPSLRVSRATEYVYRHIPEEFPNSSFRRLMVFHHAAFLSAAELQTCGKLIPKEMVIDIACFLSDLNQRHLVRADQLEDMDSAWRYSNRSEYYINDDVFLRNGKRFPSSLEFFSGEMTMGTSPELPSIVKRKPVPRSPVDSEAKQDLPSSPLEPQSSPLSDPQSSPLGEPKSSSLGLHPVRRSQYHNGARNRPSAGAIPRRSSAVQSFDSPRDDSPSPGPRKALRFELLSPKVLMRSTWTRERECWSVLIVYHLDPQSVSDDTFFETNLYIEVYHTGTQGKVLSTNNTVARIDKNRSAIYWHLEDVILDSTMRTVKTSIYGEDVKPYMAELTWSSRPGLEAGSIQQVDSSFNESAQTPAMLERHRIHRLAIIEKRKPDKFFQKVRVMESGLEGIDAFGPDSSFNRDSIISNVHSSDLEILDQDYDRDEAEVALVKDVSAEDQLITKSKDANGKAEEETRNKRLAEASKVAADKNRLEAESAKAKQVQEQHRVQEASKAKRDEDERKANEKRLADQRRADQKRLEDERLAKEAENKKVLDEQRQAEVARKAQLQEDERKADQKRLAEEAEKKKIQSPAAPKNAWGNNAGLSAQAKPAPSALAETYIQTAPQPKSPSYVANTSSSAKAIPQAAVIEEATQEESSKPEFVSKPLNKRQRRDAEKKAKQLQLQKEAEEAMAGSTNKQEDARLPDEDKGKGKFVEVGLDGDKKKDMIGLSTKTEDKVDEGTAASTSAPEPTPANAEEEWGGYQGKKKKKGGRAIQSTSMANIITTPDSTKEQTKEETDVTVAHAKNMSNTMLRERYLSQAALIAQEANAKALLEFELANSSVKQGLIKQAELANATADGQRVSRTTSHTSLDSATPRYRESLPSRTPSIPISPPSDVPKERDTETANATGRQYTARVSLKRPVIFLKGPIPLLLDNKLKQETKAPDMDGLRSPERNTITERVYSLRSSKSNTAGNWVRSAVIFDGSKPVPLKLGADSTVTDLNSTSRGWQESNAANNKTIERIEEVEEDGIDTSIIFDAENVDDEGSLPSRPVSPFHAENTSDFVSFPTYKQNEAAVFKGPLDSIEDMEVASLGAFDSGSFNPGPDLYLDPYTESNVLDHGRGDGVLTEEESGSSWIRESQRHSDPQTHTILQPLSVHQPKLPMPPPAMLPPTTKITTLATSSVVATAEISMQQRRPAKLLKRLSRSGNMNNNQSRGERVLEVEMEKPIVPGGKRKSMGWLGRIFKAKDKDESESGSSGGWFGKGTGRKGVKG